ncbi:hypothetical protein [Atopobium fossor]|uniref:hypothetical protein n=1 Tax=Atopobium fossor TaxID=39487 RepID=UPI00040E0687|nr:hypothetical protein [Atopobium fossor]
MKRIFSDREFTYNVQGKHQLRVSGEGVSYTTANGKKSLSLLFKEIGSLFLLRYCNSNISYSVTFRDTNQQFLGEIDTDVLERREATIQGHNILETKSILIAFAENKLTSAFPDNIPTLEVMLAFTLKEKAIWLKNGSLVGAKHQVKLSDICRVKCVGNGTLNSLYIYTKEKGGFFDTPDMKVPVNELTLPVLEAVMAQNTGRGIDFSQGNGFDQKTSEYIIVRYMNSTFFQNENGSVSEDWHKIAYDHIQQYQADIKLSE